MPPRCDWRIISQDYEIYCYIQPELQNINFIALRKTTIPLQLKPSPIYVGLREQLCEP